MKKFLAEANKAVAAAKSAAVAAVAGGLLTGDAKVWIFGGIATAAAFVGVYIAAENA